MSSIDYKKLYELTNGQIFIIPPDILDLDGIGKIIFDNSIFKKNDWKDKSSQEIFDAVLSHKEHIFFIKLKEFFRI